MVVKTALQWTGRIVSYSPSIEEGGEWCHFVYNNLTSQTITIDNIIEFSEDIVKVDENRTTDRRSVNILFTQVLTGKKREFVLYQEPYSKETKVIGITDIDENGNLFSGCSLSAYTDSSYTETEITIPYSGCSHKFYSVYYPVYKDIIEVSDNLGNITTSISETYSDEETIEEYSSEMGIAKLDGRWYKDVSEVDDNAFNIDSEMEAQYEPYGIFNFGENNRETDVLYYISSTYKGLLDSNDCIVTQENSGLTEVYTIITNLSGMSYQFIDDNGNTLSSGTNMSETSGVSYNEYKFDVTPVYIVYDYSGGTKSVGVESVKNNKTGNLYVAKYYRRVKFGDKPPVKGKIIPVQSRYPVTEESYFFDVSPESFNCDVQKIESGQTVSTSVVSLKNKPYWDYTTIEKEFSGAKEITLFADLHDNISEVGFSVSLSGENSVNWETRKTDVSVINKFTHYYTDAADKIPGTQDYYDRISVNVVVTQDETNENKVFKVTRNIQ